MQYGQLWKLFSGAYEKIASYCFSAEVSLVFVNLNMIFVEAIVLCSL